MSATILAAPSAPVKFDSDSWNPDTRWVVNGLDWAWAFVTFRPIRQNSDIWVGTNQSVWSNTPNQITGRRKWRRRWPSLIQGYPKLNIKRPGEKAKIASLHRLMLETFIDPCPAGMECCHWDGDRTNNSLLNLRWDTRKSNRADSIRHGTMIRGERSPSAKLKESDVRDLKFLKKSCPSVSTSELSWMFGICRADINRILRGGCWSWVDPDVIAPHPSSPPIQRESGRRNGKVNEVDIPTMKALRASGYTLKEIADRFGISLTTVGSIMKCKLEEYAESEMAKKWQTRSPIHKGKSIRETCGPLRKIVGHKHPVIELGGIAREVTGIWVEILECGHEQNQKSDFIGHTNAERRRCKKCLRQENGSE